MKFNFGKYIGFGTAGLIIIAVALVITSKPSMAPETGSKTISYSEEKPNERVFPTESKTPINDSRISAKSYLVYDRSSGRILAQRGAENPVPIASVTKLMTGYLVNLYGSLDDTVTVQAKNELSVSPSLGLTRGDQVKIRDLFNSMIVGSANDAALTLGSYVEYKTGKTIAEAMNHEAQNLGMTSTRFNNPLGFDSETNYSTADDIHLLLTAISRYPAFEALDRQLSYTFSSASGKTYAIKATNKLLSRDSEIHAIKTGFTNYAQGAMITSISHTNGSFVIIILGSSNRESDTLLLKGEIIKTFYTLKETTP